MPLFFFSFATPFAVAAWFLGASATPAYAYLDPGTGSMILQVLLGGVAGIALVGKLYWHKLLTLLGLRREEATEGEAPKSRADN
jgi:hypothetical protein